MKLTRTCLIDCSLVLCVLLFFPQGRLFSEETVDSFKSDLETAEVKRKIKTRSYSLNTNFLINEIVQGGSICFKSAKDRFLANGKASWCDNFKISYDYTELSGGYRELLMAEKTKGKEKKMLVADYRVTYEKKPFVDITYSSDKNTLTYFTFLVGGMSKEFSNGVKVEGGAGVKLGKLDFMKEKYEVLNLTVGYQTPGQIKTFKLDTKIKTYLPRKYMTSDRFDGLWMMDASSTLSYNKKIFGVLPTLGLTVRRDYFLNTQNEQEYMQGVVRYNMTLGFKFARGGKVVE